MTTLVNALKTAGFAGLTDEEALAYGGATVVIGGSDLLYTYKYVADEFSDAAAEGLYAAMKGAGLNGGAEIFLTPGWQLSLPKIQDKLTALSQDLTASGVPQYMALAQVCDALKEVGITHGTRWQLLGVDQPTLEQVTAARAAIAWDAKVQEFGTWYTLKIDEINNGTITTQEQIAGYCAAFAKHLVPDTSDSILASVSAFAATLDEAGLASFKAQLQTWIEGA